MVLWLLSLATAIGTGWLTFAGPSIGPAVDAVFLLSVAGFVTASLWVLARVLPARNAGDTPGGDDAAEGDESPD